MSALGLLLQAAPTGPASILGSPLLPMALVIVMAYFLLFRPMSKQRKELESMRAGLKAGDEVVTSGGMFGRVTRVKDDRIQLRIANGVEVEFTRHAITSVISPQERE